MKVGEEIKKFLIVCKVFIGGCGCIGEIFVDGARMLR